MAKLNPYDALVKLVETRAARQKIAYDETIAQLESAKLAQTDFQKKNP